MTEVAGEVADGLICHAFTTERYLRQVTLPAVRRGRGGRLGAFEVVGHPMIATGRTEPELAAATTAVRAQIAFYVSTPAYRPVLEVHGWGDLGEELHRLSRLARWGEMAALIDEQVLSAFAVVGEPRAVAGLLAQRSGGVFTRLVLHAPYDVAPDILSELATTLRSAARPSHTLTAGATT